MSPQSPCQPAGKTDRQRGNETDGAMKTAINKKESLSRAASPAHLVADIKKTHLMQVFMTLIRVMFTVLKVIYLPS